MFGVWLWGMILLFVGILHDTDAAYFRCYKGSFFSFDVFPLTKANLIINSTCFNRTRPTLGYTFGYMGKVDGPATTAVMSAFIATQKWNVILFDWEKEAAKGILGLQLSYALSAVPNAKIVGNDFGEAVSMMVRAGMDITTLHLLGFSLGAHVMAFTGQTVIKNGYVVPRITGMDPARELFEGPTGIDKWCASFVDIIHSDAGDYGINFSVGTADFWPNNGGRDGKQPGCPNGTFERFSPEDLCSHDRSWRLFAESISSPTAFPAAFAPDYDTWATNPASYTNNVYMGYLVNTSASGNYFLNTAATSPFGLGLLHKLVLDWLEYHVMLSVKRARSSYFISK